MMSGSLADNRTHEPRSPPRSGPTSATLGALACEFVKWEILTEPTGSLGKRLAELCSRQL